MISDLKNRRFDCSAPFKAFTKPLATKDLIEACIAEKCSRLAEYRKAALENWLLIINERFVGPGEVYVRLDDIVRWTFSFDFDKVLLYLREVGGGGEVVEVRRDSL